MATSGSINFSQTRNEILEDALSYAGVLGDEETVNSTMLTRANRVLNRLVKHLENQMLHLWKRSEATLFLQKDQESYTFGLNSTDHVTEDFVQTALSADRLAGVTKIHVDDITGMTVGDYIGTTNDDSEIEWSTISSLNNSGTRIYTIELSSALTGNASAGNTVTDTTIGHAGTLSEAAVAGDTTIYVSIAYAVSAGNSLTINLNSGSNVRTVLDADFNTITLTDALVNNSSEDNIVYTYTTKINKPLEILSCRRRTVSTDQDLPMTEMAYKDYMEMPNKTQSGTSVIQWAWNRLSDTAKFYVWTRPDNVENVVKFTYCKPIEDFDSAVDSPDLPQEWYRYLVFQTALDLCPLYGLLNNESFSQLKDLAQQAKADVLSFDNETTYIKMEMDTQGQ